MVYNATVRAFDEKDLIQQVLFGRQSKRSPARILCFSRSVVRQNGCLALRYRDKPYQISYCASRRYSSLLSLTNTHAFYNTNGSQSLSRQRQHSSHRAATHLPCPNICQTLPFRLPNRSSHLSTRGLSPFRPQTIRCKTTHCSYRLIDTLPRKRGRAVRRHGCSVRDPRRDPKGGRCR